MRGRYVLVAGALGLGLLGALLWSMTDESRHGGTASTPRRQQPPAPIPSAPTMAAPAPSPAPEVHVTPASGYSTPESRAVAAAKLDETIRHYRETMTYPAWSRPADASNRHLTDWNRAIEVAEVFAEDASRRAIEGWAQIDRIFAAPGEHVALRVEVRYADNRAPAPAEQVSAELQVRDKDTEQWSALAPIELLENGGRWTGDIHPASQKELRSSVREVRVAVVVRRGDFSRELTLGFAYAIEPPVVARGLVRERASANGLELDLEVEVAEAAPVALWATLFSADGKVPIAVFEDRFFPKRAGRQAFTVRIFGKVLRERGIDGPYRLAAIHGYQYRKDATPDQVLFSRADTPQLTTGPHQSSSFSAQAYQDPEIAARLAHYEAVREALRAGRQPPPPPPTSQQ